MDKKPGDGNADKLFRYWVEDPDNKWKTRPHPFSTLVRHLEKHMTPAQAKGLAAKIFKRAFGIWPGERAGSNPAGPG